MDRQLAPCESVGTHCFPSLLRGIIHTIVRDRSWLNTCPPKTILTSACSKCRTDLFWQDSTHDPWGQTCVDAQSVQDEQHQCHGPAHRLMLSAVPQIQAADISPLTFKIVYSLFQTGHVELCHVSEFENWCSASFQMSFFNVHYKFSKSFLSLQKAINCSWKL